MCIPKKSVILFLLCCFVIIAKAQSVHQQQSVSKEKVIHNIYNEQFAIAIEYWLKNDFDNAKKNMTAAADKGYQPALWYAYKLTKDNKYLIATAHAGGKRAYADAAAALITLTYPNTSHTDFNLAYKWYMMATKEQITDGALNSMCNIGQMYLQGQGDLDPDYDKAMQWYQKAADWLFPRAVREIGVKHIQMAKNTSSTVKKQRYTAIAYSHFAMAAFAGDEKAAIFCNEIRNLELIAPAKALLEAVRLIIASQKFNEKTIKLLKEAAAQNNLFAHIILGDYYFNIDKKNSAAYYQNAASQGALYAKKKLLDHSFINIVPENERMKYCKEFSDSGYSFGKFNYAWMLEKKGNMQKAFQLYRELADAGDAHAQFRMWNLIYSGKVTETVPKGLLYLTQAALQHYGEAEVNMGQTFMRDILGLSDRSAMILIMKGVIDGIENPKMLDIALDEIARGYAWGQGVKKDTDFAVEICIARIKNGESGGYFTLGQFYEHGVFGKKDIENAKKFYKAGTDMGNSFCKRSLDRLSSTQTK